MKPGRIALTTLLLLAPKADIPSLESAQKSSLKPTGKYEWVRLTDSAAFPGSYNFTMFTINGELWVFHHAGVWHSRNGREWAKTLLPNILNDAFIDYVQFKGAVYALGSFEGNIERFTETSRISRTTDLNRWDVIAEQSNIPQRYFYTTIVFKGKIWMLGGEYRDTTFNDVWNSDDGVHWTLVSKSNPWKSSGWGKGAVVFNERIYLLSSEANKPVRAYSSADGIDWRMEANPVHPVPFWGAKAIVFNKTIWLLGCNRSGAFTNEVVYSVDGKNWTTDHAPWTPRGGVAATVMAEKLYITGGKYSYGTGESIRFVYSNDVWCMENPQ